MTEVELQERVELLLRQHLLRNGLDAELRLWAEQALPHDLARLLARLERADRGDPPPPERGDRAHARTDEHSHG